MSGMQAGMSSDYHYRVAELKRENAKLRDVLEAAECLIAHDDNDPDSGLTAQSYDEAWTTLRAAVEDAEGCEKDRLYAAAPTMLAALKDARVALRAIGEHHRVDGAIQKAIGGSHD